MWLEGTTEVCSYAHFMILGAALRYSLKCECVQSLNLEVSLAGTL